MKIITLTLNPALDRTEIVRKITLMKYCQLNLCSVTLVAKVCSIPSLSIFPESCNFCINGLLTGLNVARTLVSLHSNLSSSNSLTATGVLHNDSVGQQIIQLLNAEHICHSFHQVASGVTRTNIMIVEKESGEAGAAAGCAVAAPKAARYIKVSECACVNLFFSVMASPSLIGEWEGLKHQRTRVFSIFGSFASFAYFPKQWFFDSITTFSSCILWFTSSGSAWQCVSFFDWMVSPIWMHNSTRHEWPCAAWGNSGSSFSR